MDNILRIGDSAQSAGGNVGKITDIYLIEDGVIVTLKGEDGLETAYYSEYIEPAPNNQD